MVAMLGLPVAHDSDEDGIARQHRMCGRLPAAGHVGRDGLQAAMQQELGRALRLAWGWGRNSHAEARYEALKHCIKPLQGVAFPEAARENATSSLLRRTKMQRLAKAGWDQMTLREPTVMSGSQRCVWASTS